MQAQHRRGYRSSCSERLDRPDLAPRTGFARRLGFAVSGSRNERSEEVSVAFQFEHFQPLISQRRIIVLGSALVAIAFQPPATLYAQQRVVPDSACLNCVVRAPNPISLGARFILKPQSLQCPQQSFSLQIGTSANPSLVPTLRSLNELPITAPGQGTVTHLNCIASPVRLSPQLELQGSINLKQAHRLFRGPSPADSVTCPRKAPGIGRELPGKTSC